MPSYPQKLPQLYLGRLSRSSKNLVANLERVYLAEPEEDCYRLYQLLQHLHVKQSTLIQTLWSIKAAFNTF